jgi:transposase InsO family protein
VASGCAARRGEHVLPRARHRWQLDAADYVLTAGRTCVIFQLIVGQLVAYVTALGVEAITGKPYKPTAQGKNERFHQALFRWLERQRDLVLRPARAGGGMHSRAS